MILSVTGNHTIYTVVELVSFYLPDASFTCMFGFPRRRRLVHTSLLSSVLSCNIVVFVIIVV